MGLLPDFGNLVFTLGAFVVALSIIVTVHEFGHYIVGRWSGIHAEVFSLGFGPVLLRRTDRRGTQWQIAALPSGSALVSLFAGDGLHGGQDMAALIAESCRHDLNVVCPAVDIDAAVRFLTGTVASYMSDSFPARRYGARRAGAF